MDAILKSARVVNNQLISDYQMYPSIPQLQVTAQMLKLSHLQAKDGIMIE